MIDSLGEVGAALNGGMPESQAELCAATGLQICYEPGDLHHGGVNPDE